MAFGGGFESKHGRKPMAEMNMIPLIDIMLVLLVIFIVTAPLLTHSVKLELPKAASKTIETVPEKINLSIQADGELYWNGSSIDKETLDKRFQEAAKKSPAPELHIYADKHADYQFIAEALSSASNAGLTTIGFVTKPKQSDSSSTTD